MPTMNAPTAQLAELARALEIFLVEQCEDLDPHDWAPLREQLERWLPTFEQLLSQKDWAGLERAVRQLQAWLQAPTAPPRELPARVQAVLRAYSQQQGAGPELNPPSVKGPFMGPPSELASKSLGQVGGLLKWLVERRPAPVPITTYPTLRVPPEVRPLTTFTVEVSARPQVSCDGATRAVLPRSSDRPVDLEVILELPADGSLVARSPGEGVLRIGADGQAATLGFAVFAERPGVHTVTVAFRQGGIERTRCQRKVTVQAAAQSPAGPGRAAPAAAAAAVAAATAVAAAATVDAAAALSGPSLVIGSAFRGLLLQLHERPGISGARGFQVILGGPGWSGRPLECEIRLPAAAPELLAALCRELPEEASPLPLESRELRLRSIGSNLAQQALPLELRSQLADSRWPAGTALHIESDDAWLPWEALWLGASADPAGGIFLGERFAVTRWLRTGSARERVGGKAAVLVASTSSGLALEPERQILQEITGQPPIELRALPAVQKCLLGDPACRIFHFAGHGGSEAGKSFAESLQLDGGYLHATDIRLSEPGVAGPLDAGMVFLNACEAGIEQPGLWAHGGWASQFLRAGVGALIAPSWTISDRGAGAFAESFYRHAAAGCTLGEAARRARCELAPRSPLDRIAYAVYAAPQSHLHLQ